MRVDFGFLMTFLLGFRIDHGRAGISGAGAPPYPSRWNLPISVPPPRGGNEGSARDGEDEWLVRAAETALWLEQDLSLVKAIQTNLTPRWKA